MNMTKINMKKELLWLLVVGSEEVCLYTTPLCNDEDVHFTYDELLDLRLNHGLSILVNHEAVVKD